ncbi:helix-turn-helix transcriptional regulator [Methylocapsa sp. S129]|uniref:helix-turn-helix transcriptional regulator n=1 Tax=Methylocapsa sp. S129 TaxID=1641869 RepID=UPI00131D5188|nr:helix-turn-helix transcriptional regulator [Methylocapsa sp. S129]
MDVLRISTAALPPEHRAETFREVFGRKILKFEMEPKPGALFEVDMTLQSLPGLGIGAGSLSPMRNSLTTPLIDNDDLILVILRAGSGTAQQHGREETIRDGQAIVTANDAQACFVAHTQTQVINLRFERKKLAEQLADVDSSVLRPMARDNQALRLLTSYVRLMNPEFPRSTLDLQRIAADHIYDLGALALGATRDATEIAKGRGVRIARVHAIKADVIANIGANWLSADALAARHGVSPRYIRSLFQGEETTFTDFVLGQRLARAHRLLVASRLDGSSISAIAFEAGFDDLSYFNRCFRRRYEATPSDIRAAARRGGER